MAQEKGRSDLVVGYDVSVLLDKDIKDVKAAAELWIGQVAKKSGFTAEIVLYKDSATLQKAFKDGKLDMVTTTTFNYLHIAEKIDTELAYSGIYNNNKTTRKYLLIVRSDAGFAKLKDLARKRLAVPKTDDAALLFLNTTLLQNKLPEAAGFFSSIIEKKKASQAVLSVFFRQSDACLTTREVFDTMKELNPQVGRQLKAIASSSEMVCQISFFRKTYNKKTKAMILKAAANLVNTVAGKQLLTMFKLSDIYLLKDSDLDSFKSLFNEYRQLKENVPVREHKSE